MSTEQDALHTAVLNVVRASAAYRALHREKVHDRSYFKRLAAAQRELFHAVDTLAKIKIAAVRGG